MDDASFNCESRPFPRSAWSRYFIGQATRDEAQPPVQKFLKPEWSIDVTMQPPPTDIEHLRAECLEVLQAKSLRAQRLMEILPEAEGAAEAMLWPIQGLLIGAQDLDFKPATNALISALINESWTPTFYFKQVFNRGRPQHCCDLPIDPMFPAPHRNYPGHPSYPAGHAVQSRIVALAYGMMFPDMATKFIEAADRIAENRVVAGVHFTSDLVAGKTLAEDIFELIRKESEFIAMVDAARAEWPDGPCPLPPAVSPG